MAVRKIAIACQGGGTHAAFTWGVLTEILRTQQAWDNEAGNGDTFKVVAISGTSAGALNALAAWYGLVPNAADPACGSPEKAIERLDFLWTTFAATTFAETMHNSVVASLLEWKAKGAPFPGLNPYHPQGNLALTGLAMMGARPEYLGFAGLLAVLCPDFASIDWTGVRASGVRMIAGAIEVLSGNFEIFDSDKTLEQLGLLPGGARIDQYDATRWRMRRPISLEGVAASGTLPDVLPAQRIPETTFPTCEPGQRLVRDGMYWDGLFSQNPPVRDLLDHEGKDEKPDEIWVVRINSQEIYPDSMDLNLEDIRDRENALAGNLSLNQELDHILSMNRWIEVFGDQHPPLQNRKIVSVRTIKMRRETAWGLRHTSKFNRDIGHLTRLRDEGQAVTQQWLSDWRALGDGFSKYPDDARYPGLVCPPYLNPVDGA
jgi:NTE family protein